MGPSYYKVKVLHYLNPHLMWVLVENDKEAITFEQIGIYGVLPVNMTINIEGMVVNEHSDDWMLAVRNEMQKTLQNASEVWFSPTYIDKKTSIFDDNSHKYGDIAVKLNNGTLTNLSDVITASGVAIQDECLFHQQLRNGSLKTTNSFVDTIDIILKIQNAYTIVDIPKNLWEKALNAQITVFNEEVRLEKLSPRNLELHYRENVNKKLINKINDLKLCKDVDDESFGRASSLKSSRSPSLCNRLQNRASLLKRPEESFEENTDLEDSFRSNDEEAAVLPENDYIKPQIEVPVNIKAPKATYFKKKAKNPKTPTEEKQMIGYGPPGLNPTSIAFKVKETRKDIEDENKMKIEDQEKDENIIGEEKAHEPQDFNQDMYGKEDSEINIEITNIDSLKTKLTDTTNNIINRENVGRLNNTLKHRLELLKAKKVYVNSKLSTFATERNDFSSTESITSLVCKIDLNNPLKNDQGTEEKEREPVGDVKNNVNPFKNVDGSQSVFVDKLVSPALLVHTKKGNRIQPICNMSDIPFTTDIHIILRNMSINFPMRVQTVSWKTILRGHSMFIISPYGSGKTIGYLPAVCRLVSDYKENSESGLSCIILCATSSSVSHVENLSKMFLHKAKIIACYAGMDDVHITTSCLNGCNLLICTPTMFVRLLQGEFGVDLRDLATFVIDDCERIAEVYSNELKYSLKKVKEAVKSRVNKEFKVQYVVASRIWCDFMTPLAKKVPDTVICIGAFQECVLYSEAKTSVDFVRKENKIDSVLTFFKDIDGSKKTVIACRTDDEVRNVEKALTRHGYVVFSCDSTMTIFEVHKLATVLRDYQEPITGPILVCCDSNLTHLNVTDASYLIHYSLPNLFSIFCKRFAVLIDNYRSVFESKDNKVKIKILLENLNVEQLPKILNFIKRCTDAVPESLDDIASKVLVEKDLNKAEKYIPLCNSLLTLGKCPDFWNCKERHTIFKKYDEPKTWLPKNGVITFKILHYNSAVSYSALILSNNVNNKTIKYPNMYNSLAVQMGMYYSKEDNRKLHGVPKVGDICAVSLKQSFFARCQVMNILSYTQRGEPHVVLINLIDEEKYEKARDTCLYHLPDELKNVETHVTRVVLANITPRDKDISHSDLVTRQLRKITDQNADIFMRGKIALVIGSVVFVDTLEACQNVVTMGERIVISNFCQKLLDGHGICNPEHIQVLQKMCTNIYKVDTDSNKEKNIDETAVIPYKTKTKPKIRWSHLEANDFSSVFFLSAENPEKLFIRLTKFKDVIESLLKDIKKYVKDIPKPLDDYEVGDIVIAEFPDDAIYERARIEEIYKENKVKCFFVDQGDWRDVVVNKLFPITDKLISQLPFQSIECRLIGIQPVGENWTDFETNWLADSCLDEKGDLKYLFAKYFTKEKAESTDGYKYGIVLLDTYEEDVVINKLIIENNMAVENEEIKYLNDINFKSNSSKRSDSEDWSELSEPVFDDSDSKSDIPPVTSSPIGKPLRSIPLVGSESEDDSTTWDFNQPENFVELLKNNKLNQKPVVTEIDNTNKDKIKTSNVEKENKVNQDSCKPKLVWRQDKNNVIIKIQLTIETDYEITIKVKSIDFNAYVNDTKYAFEISLYGVVDVKKCLHSNKGLYIQVNLKKVFPCKWLALTSDRAVPKWIVYDIDNIDVTSDHEDEKHDDDHKKTINVDDSDTDDDFFDDLNM